MCLMPEDELTRFRPYKEVASQYAAEEKQRELEFLSFPIPGWFQQLFDVSFAHLSSGLRSDPEAILPIVYMYSIQPQCFTCRIDVNCSALHVV